MPKFNLDINGVDQEAAEGYDVWDGPTPKPGVYDARLKVAKIVVIDPEGRNKSKNSGANRISIGCELERNTGELAKFNGFTAWSGVNLVESGIGYVNQFLRALTDGSDEEFDKIKHAFYEGALIVDEKKEHITDIGRWEVGSPDGHLPIKITLRNRVYKTVDADTGGTVSRTGVEIGSFLMPGEGATSSATGGADEEAAEEPEEPDLGELGDVDDSIFDAAEDEPVSTG